MFGESLLLRTAFPRSKRDLDFVALRTALRLVWPSAWESLYLNMKGCQAPPSYLKLTLTK